MPIATKTKNLVQYLATVRLSEKGQLVLPKEYRSEQKLESGAPITVLKVGNSLLLLPEMQKFNTLCDSIERTLTDNGVTSEQLLETLPETRRELFAELYPELAESKDKPE